MKKFAAHICCVDGVNPDCVSAVYMYALSLRYKLGLYGVLLVLVLLHLLHKNSDSIVCYILCKMGRF